MRTGGAAATGNAAYGRRTAAPQLRHSSTHEQHHRWHHHAPASRPPRASSLCTAARRGAHSCTNAGPTAPGYSSRHRPTQSAGASSVHAAPAPASGLRASPHTATPRASNRASSCMSTARRAGVHRPVTAAAPSPAAGCTASCALALPPPPPPEHEPGCSAGDLTGMAAVGRAGGKCRCRKRVVGCSAEPRGTGDAPA